MISSGCRPPLGDLASGDGLCRGARRSHRWLVPMKIVQRRHRESRQAETTRAGAPPDARGEEGKAAARVWPVTDIRCRAPLSRWPLRIPRDPPCRTRQRLVLQLQRAPGPYRRAFGGFHGGSLASALISSPCYRTARVCAVAIARLVSLRRTHLRGTSRLPWPLAAASSARHLPRSRV